MNKKTLPIIVIAAVGLLVLLAIVGRRMLELRSRWRSAAEIAPGVPATLPAPRWHTLVLTDGSVEGAIWFDLNDGTRAAQPGLAVRLVHDAVDADDIKLGLEAALEDWKGYIAWKRQGVAAPTGSELEFNGFISLAEAESASRDATKAIEDLPTKMDFSAAYNLVSSHTRNHQVYAFKGNIGGMATADAAGKFRFEKMNPGKYYVQAWVDNQDAAPHWIVPVVVTTGQSTHVDLNATNYTPPWHPGMK